MTMPGASARIRDAAGRRAYLSLRYVNLSHTEHPQVASDWTTALQNDRIAVSPVVAFEVLYTAQSQADFEALEKQLDALRQVPLTRAIVRNARAALHTLSATTRHRPPFQDALIAASAAHKNWGVLHYDGHFDTLSEVLDFESRWIAPPKSL